MNAELFSLGLRVSNAAASGATSLHYLPSNIPLQIELNSLVSSSNAVKAIVQANIYPNVALTTQNLKAAGNTKVYQTMNSESAFTACKCVQMSTPFSDVLLRCGTIS